MMRGPGRPGKGPVIMGVGVPFCGRKPRQVCFLFPGHLCAEHRSPNGRDGGASRAHNGCRQGGGAEGAEREAAEEAEEVPEAAVEEEMAGAVEEEGAGGGGGGVGGDGGGGGAGGGGGGGGR